MSQRNRSGAWSCLFVVVLCGLGIVVGLLYGSDLARLRGEGFGTSWKLLKGSVEFSKIINATPDAVWAQSSNGHIYSFLRNCFGEPRCGQWSETQNVPDNIYARDVESVEIGTACPHAESFKYLKYPPGNIVECAYSLRLGMDIMPGQISYYALLDNGKIWVWSYTGGSMLEGLIYTLVFAVLFPISGLLFVIVIRFIIRMLKLRNQKAKNGQIAAG